jgi:hypothetical protein
MTRPIDPTEPFARGNVLHGFRAAAHELWGDEGLRVIGEHLSSEARAVSLESIVLAVSWYPVRFASAWHEAVWEGPARRDDAALCKFVARAVDLGIGRIRKVLFGFATPDMLFAKAPSIWRDQHTHGTLSAVREGKSKTIFTLRDHPYTKLPISRRFTAESYRYIGSLTGIRCKETHKLEGDALVVRVEWA